MPPVGNRGTYGRQWSPSQLVATAHGHQRLTVAVDASYYCTHQHNEPTARIGP